MEVVTNTHFEWIPVNCQKACKKCDEARPCARCVKFGIQDTCRDSERKERNRGLKRGAYKRKSSEVYESRLSHFHKHHDSHYEKQSKHLLPPTSLKASLSQSTPTPPPPFSQSPQLAMAAEFDPRAGGLVTPILPAYHHIYITPAGPTDVDCVEDDIESRSPTPPKDDEEKDWNKLQVLSSLCSAVLGNKGKEPTQDRHFTSSYPLKHPPPIPDLHQDPVSPPLFDSLLPHPFTNLYNYTYLPSYPLHHSHDLHHHPVSRLTHLDDNLFIKTHMTSLHHMSFLRRPWEVSEEGYDEATVLMNRYTEVGEDDHEEEGEDKSPIEQKDLCKREGLKVMGMSAFAGGRGSGPRDEWTMGFNFS
ncbi:hypothetical protein SpCBS45565_g06514 [Spizellomyces sp. 'palustris']|nr:hypothetical protein SpCBS45565_g06514 [Spizellomyces sp. 'palustris']